MLDWLGKTKSRGCAFEQICFVSSRPMNRISPSGKLQMSQDAHLSFGAGSSGGHQPSHGQGGQGGLALLLLILLLLPLLSPYKERGEGGAAGE